MKKNQINHNALTHLVEAGAVPMVIVKAVGDTWALTVQVGDSLKIVMAKNSGKPRVWRKLDTLAKYLKGIGIDKFHTDVTKYDPLQKTLRRPDSANILKQTHKSHQSLQQQTPKATARKTKAPELKVNIQSEPKKRTTTVEPAEVAEPIKVNSTDKAIQLAKERWEHRRKKILQEADPRAK